MKPLTAEEKLNLFLISLRPFIDTAQAMEQTQLCWGCIGKSSLSREDFERLLKLYRTVTEESK